MSTTPKLIATLLLVPAIGLMGWAWRSLARLDRGLRELGPFEVSHFEIGAQAGTRSAAPPWAAPGR